LILNVFVAVLTSGIADADESSSDAAAMFAQSNKSQPSTGAQARPRLAAPDPAHRTAPHRTANGEMRCAAMRFAAMRCDAMRCGWCGTQSMFRAKDIEVLLNEVALPFALLERVSPSLCVYCPSSDWHPLRASAELYASASSRSRHCRSTRRTHGNAAPRRLGNSKNTTRGRQRCS
jgi:hypothetical protein